MLTEGKKSPELKYRLTMHMTIVRSDTLKQRTEKFAGTLMLIPRLIHHIGAVLALSSNLCIRFQQESQIIVFVLHVKLISHLISVP